MLQGIERVIYKSIETWSWERSYSQLPPRAKCPWPAHDPSAWNLEIPEMLLDPGEKYSHAHPVLYDDHQPKLASGSHTPTRHGLDSVRLRYYSHQVGLHTFAGAKRDATTPFSKTETLTLVWVCTTVFGIEPPDVISAIARINQPSIWHSLPHASCLSTKDPFSIERLPRDDDSENEIRRSYEVILIYRALKPF